MIAKFRLGKEKLRPKTAPVIEFKNVWFKYPSTKNFVLKKINFKIDTNEEIALVGTNGAGKTTLIKLLLRFYDPTKGKILINGKDIKEYDLNSYYKLIGVLLQEYSFYNELDVKSNICIGKPNKAGNTKKIIKAAKNAKAHEFIMELDNKYKQILAKQFTGGTKISKGQKQKIALGRMFYRNAPILILDEPTSSIDAMAEQKIFDKIYDFTDDKTVIIISHRFSTVRKAQRIYVLENGEITEEGSHSELLKLDGAYAESFKTQAKGYK